MEFWPENPTLEFGYPHWIVVEYSAVNVRPLGWNMVKLFKVLGGRTGSPGTDREKNICQCGIKTEKIES